MAGANDDSPSPLDQPLAPEDGITVDTKAQTDAGYPSTNTAAEMAQETYPFITGIDERPRTKVTVTKYFTETEAGTPEDAERLRLRTVDSYYRGTPAGAWNLSNYYKLSHLHDGEQETLQRKTQIEIYRPIYQEIATDLANFDRMAAFENAAQPDRWAQPDFDSLLKAAFPESGNLISTLVGNPINRWEEIKAAISVQTTQRSVARRAMLPQDSSSARFPR